MSDYRRPELGPGVTGNRDGLLITPAERDQLSKAIAELSILTASAIMHALDHAGRCDQGDELVGLLAQHSRDIEPVLVRLMPFTRNRADVEPGLD